jgi:hypothetical protein
LPRMVQLLNSCLCPGILQQCTLIQVCWSSLAHCFYKNKGKAIHQFLRNWCCFSHLSWRERWANISFPFCQKTIPNNSDATIMTMNRDKLYSGLLQ